MATQETVGEVVTPSPQAQPSNPNPSAGNYYPASARSFAQVFGLHPAIAFLTFIVDNMLFAGEGATLGMSLPFSVVCAGVLGVITFMAQRKFYGDDSESAFIKALILAFLTAVPTSLPGCAYVTAGVVGFFRRSSPAPYISSSSSNKKTDGTLNDYC